VRSNYHNVLRSVGEYFQLSQYLRTIKAHNPPVIFADFYFGSDTDRCRSLHDGGSVLASVFAELDGIDKDNKAAEEVLGS
jgi:hypothetical protein